MCMQALFRATHTRNLADWLGVSICRMASNSVSRSWPHCANRIRSSLRTVRVSLRVWSMSSATNRESLRTTACAGVTS
eukprot:jgi/Psemu1/175489/gw1.135.99.1